VLAEQEFHSIAGPSKGVLIVLSDFIHENKDIDFRRDRRLSDRITAKSFATEIAHEMNVNFAGIPVYLGMLRSREFGALRKGQKEGLQEFWTEYFKHSGAQSKLVADGPGLLELTLKTFCQ